MAKSRWMLQVGERVRAARKRAKKNQAELGVSPVTVGKIEAGGGGTLRALEKMAAALGLPSANVFFGTERDPADTDSGGTTVKGPLSRVAEVSQPVNPSVFHAVGQQEGSEIMELTKDEKAVIALWNAGQFAALRTMMRERGPKRKEAEPKARRHLQRVFRKK